MFGKFLSKLTEKAVELGKEAEKASESIAKALGDQEAMDALKKKATEKVKALAEDGEKLLKEKLQEAKDALNDPENKSTSPVAKAIEEALKLKPTFGEKAEAPKAEAKEEQKPAAKKTAAKKPAAKKPTTPKK